MDMIEMGQVHAFLLRFRCVETKARANRKIRSDEREIGRVLSLATPEEMMSFNDFLDGQGLEVRSFDDMTLPGLPSGGRVFILARKPAGELPAFFSIDRLYYKMKLRDTESNDVAAIWFLDIWLIHLALIYTMPNRAVSEVSRYVDAVFKKDVLINSVRDHIESIRQVGVTKDGVVCILTDEKGEDVAKRCKGFLDVMEEAGLLEVVDKDTYQQTILSAYELDRSFEHGLANLLPQEDILQGLKSIVLAEETGG